MNTTKNIKLKIPIDSLNKTIFIEKYVDVTLRCRPTKVPISQLTKMATAIHAFDYMKTVMDAEQMHVKEFFYVIALNRYAKLLGVMKISEGGIHGTVADVRLVLCFLIGVLASGVIICHNHPSGNLQPSDNDKLLTRKIIEACRFCEIEFYDHVIISTEGFFSFRDNNLL